MKIDIYEASDYAGMKTPEYDFYYGYEVTSCAKHQSQEDCEDADCSDSEWCFTATEKETGNVFKISQSNIEKQLERELGGDSCALYLLAGIGAWMRLGEISP